MSNNFQILSTRDNFLTNRSQFPRRRHSTNSLYFSGSPLVPDHVQTVLGVSVMIRSMLRPLSNFCDQSSIQFNASVNLNTDNPSDRLLHSLGVTIEDLDAIESNLTELETLEKSTSPGDSRNDADLPGQPIPTLLSDTFRFVEAVLEVSGLGSTGAVCACVLLLRLLVMARIELTPGNWKTLWLLSVVLVEKLHRDRPVRVRERYLSVFSGLSMSEFLGLELRMLRDLDFFTSISRQDYLKVYLELRGFVLDYVDRGLLAPPWTVTELRISI